MTTEIFTSHMLVNSALVGEEILVDEEGHFQRTVGHQLSLDGLHIARNIVSLSEEVLILLVLNGISILALLNAFRGLLGLSARRILTLSVMLALDPKPLQLSFKTAPQEEGGDSVAVSMEVKMSSADGANYEGKTTNLKFVFSADEITVDNDGAQSTLPDFNQTTFNFSMKKNGR